MTSTGTSTAGPASAAATSSGPGGWWSRYAVCTGRPGACSRTRAARASTPAECRGSGEPWARRTISAALIWRRLLPHAVPEEVAHRDHLADDHDGRGPHARAFGIVSAVAQGGHGGPLLRRPPGLDDGDGGV